MFWEGDHAVYRKAGGYARIAALVKQIRVDSRDCLFCDCGDTFHGTFLAQKTQGKALIPILNSMGIDAMTAQFSPTSPARNYRVATGLFEWLALLCTSHSWKNYNE